MLCLPAMAAETAWQSSFGYLHSSAVANFHSLFHLTSHGACLWELLSPGHFFRRISKAASLETKAVFLSR